MGENKRLLKQEEFIMDVTEAICMHMQNNNMSRKELADLLGKTKGFVSQVLNSGRNLTIRTFADIAYAMGTTPLELLKAYEDYEFSSESQKDWCPAETGQVVSIRSARRKKPRQVQFADTYNREIVLTTMRCVGGQCG